MHICFITNEYPKLDFPHGGVGTFIHTLGHKLIEKGHQVSIIGMNNYTHIDEVEKVGDVSVFRLKPSKVICLSWFFNTQAINKCLQVLHKEIPIDIVETTELGLAFIRKIKPITYIIRLNGGHHFFAKFEKRKVRFRHALMEKRSFSKADALIAVSDFVGKETLNLLNLNHKTYTVIYNPVDVDRFYQSDPKNIGKRTIFFAGTLIEKKGIRQLIESLNYLVDDFPKLKLYVAGRDANFPGTNIPYRPILEKAITKKVEKHIEFLGVIPNNIIPDYIAKSQLCCYPSHMEAMPLAWLEVLAMGKILIGGSTGPGPEAILDGVTGFLVDPTDPKAIADKIRYVFNNYDSCVKIAQNGFERIRKEFDVNVIVSKNIEFYKEVIKDV